VQRAACENLAGFAGEGTSRALRPFLISLKAGGHLAAQRRGNASSIRVGLRARFVSRPPPLSFPRTWFESSRRKRGTRETGYLAGNANPEIRFRAKARGLVRFARARGGLLCASACRDSRARPTSSRIIIIYDNPMTRRYVPLIVGKCRNGPR